MEIRNNSFLKPLISRDLTNRRSNKFYNNRHPYLLNESLLLPRNMQPPHMFGPRGATLPPRFLKSSEWFSNSNHNSMNMVEKGEFYCETCDRGFWKSEQLKRHKAEHEVCKIDGCQFVAHPKIITKHIQMQHSNGLYKKIAKLNDPEEIKKWREERKKNYPTLQNIERKKATLVEKIKRGEKMGLGKIKSHLRENEKLKTKKSLRKRRRKIIKHEEVKITTNRGLTTFSGVHNLIGFYDKSSDELSNEESKVEIDDEEWIQENVQETGETKVCSALSKLICNYQSSDEELPTANQLVERPPTEISKIIIKDIVLESVVAETFDIGNESGPEEMKTETLGPQISDNFVKEIECKNEKSSNICKNINESSNIKKLIRRPKNNRRTPSTLLEKLLHGEIKHERNVILQCVRHIVKNNYFDN